MCDGFLNFIKNDEKFMRRALKLAAIASKIDEVPVGCVIVKDNKVIATGYNKREIDNNPLGHAETIAIKKAAKKLGDWQLVDCDLYVTIEPCLMCAGAIIQSRINKVVYGAPDLKGGAFGSSINVLEASNINHRPEIVSGVLADECAKIIKGYFKSKRS